MSSELHAVVHSANSEPGVTTGETDDPGSPVGRAGKHRLRRARVTKNPTSTLFSQDPTEPPGPPKTVIRCSYNKNNARSHENIFGGPDPNARTRSLVQRFETPTNTKENLFGDPSMTAAQPSVAAASAASSGTHAKDTFHVLFGVPELIQNERRPYEEDTYTKLFGEPDAVPHGRDARENTQANLFGPSPPPPPQRPNSQAENTQDDLFGPPLPAKACRVGKTRDRSLLYLFKPEALLEDPVPPMRPSGLNRAGRLNAETQEKLFGDPPRTAPPPAMREDTTRNLFAPLEMDDDARIAQYEESRYNPITGEGHSEKHTASPPSTTTTTKPRFKRPPTPAPFSLGCGLDASRDPKDAPVVRMILEQQRKRWAQLNTITGDPTSYSSASARKIEC